MTDFGQLDFDFADTKICFDIHQKKDAVAAVKNKHDSETDKR